MALTHKKGPVLAQPCQWPDEDEEGGLTLREFRQLDYHAQKKLAAHFSLEEAGEEERRLLLIVSAVCRKLASLLREEQPHAPGERFLIAFIELAARQPLSYYAVHKLWRQFESDWEQRACAVRLSREDGQDPDDDDLYNKAESARDENKQEANR